MATHCPFATRLCGAPGDDELERIHHHLKCIPDATAPRPNTGMLHNLGVGGIQVSGTTHPDLGLHHLMKLRLTTVALSALTSR
jgi:hypothetical protein